MNYVYINRVLIEPITKNILDIEKLKVFKTFESALADINEYLKLHKLNSTYDKHIEFKDERLYVFQNFMDDQYIFIERHSI
jgi:hypothetical protein